MSGLAIVLIVWIVLSPLWAYLLGRAIRRNTRTHTPAVRGPHTAAQARHTRRRR